MSYYLMVFEKSKAPNSPDLFMQWYEKQTQWSEEHDYQSIGVAAPALQNWFMEMKETFPPMNGEYTPTDEQIEKDENLEAHLGDYCIGTEVIYTAFAWTVAEEAYQKARALAKKYDVGFVDVNQEKLEIILPEDTAADKFIPKTAQELFDRLTKENIKGNMTLEKNRILWQRAEHVLLKILVENFPGEGYIEVCRTENGKEKPMNHWHPAEDEIYDDIIGINKGEEVFIIKTSIFGKTVFMMPREEFNARKRKYKNTKFHKYEIIEV